ncbi:MAG: type II secretion system F family protein, partial [Candidatus Omnitrophica bacterium]|nr:type II secretion system F family protein [Candidatus Omnitrophota bacterium]
MGSFSYVAKDRSGRSLTGNIEAGSDLEVIEILHKQDLIVVSVESLKKKTVKKAKKGKVKLDDIVIFSRQLATMIDAGIPLVQCLGILAEQIESANLKSAVTNVQQDIEGGMSFCDSLAKHPQIFSDFFINMVRAGETSGMLGEVLDRLATYFEKTAALTRKIRSSMVYPAVVVTIAALITSVLLLKVVPTFKGIFDTLGGQLPFPTLVLIAISDIFRKWFFLVVIGFGLFGFVLKKYIDTDKGRRNFDKQKLKVLIIGNLFRKVAIAKFARTFSTLVKSGVSVLSALDIVATTSGNKVVEESVLNCRTSVREGETIAAPLQKSGIFP